MRALPLVAVLLLSTSVGCETVTPSTCDPYTATATQYYAGGQTQGGVYMSSLVNEELLYFPGGMHYSLEHRLGQTPSWWHSSLSFESIASADGGLSIAQAAGNQALVLRVNEEVIEVANDSCVPYWLLVTAGVGATTPSGP